MKTIKLLITAVLCFVWAAAALADVAPPIKVRLMKGSGLPVEGEPFKGRLEISTGYPGQLTDFRFESDSWLTVSIDAPASRDLAQDGKMEIPFEVRPLTGSQDLVFLFEIDGFTIRKNLNLTRAHALSMENPAPVKEVQGDFAPAPIHSMESAPVEDEEPIGMRGERDSDENAASSTNRTIRVRGRFTYSRGDGTIMGADGVNVRIYDEDASADDLLASVATDAYGYYDVYINTDDAGEINPDLYVQFRAANSKVNVRDVTWEEIYYWQTGTWNNYSGSDLNVGSLEPADEAQHPSLHILTDITRTWRWLLNREGYDVTFVGAFWPDGDTGAWYEPWSTEIHISTDRQWNEATHSHEYGHHFLTNYSTTVDPDYCNGICDSPSGCGHCIWCQETDHDAFNEGWPNWLADVLTRSYAGDYGTPSDFTRSQENLDTCGAFFDDPYLTEGFLGAVIRDIEDSTNDNHTEYPDQSDVLSLGTNEIFDVVDFDEPTTPIDFLHAFKARYPNHRENLWETAMNSGYQIDEDTPLVVTNLTSTSHSTSGDSPDPTIDFTWTTAYDDASGIAGYGLYISAAGGSPSTVMDIGDVTSYTTETLAPGTYYFTIRAVDRAGRWSTGYGTFGPVTIRTADPTDLTYHEFTGWDYPLVPSDINNSTAYVSNVSTTLTGDSGSTYWNVRGRNVGEVSTGVGFQTRLYVDDVYRWWLSWGAVNGNTNFYGINAGGITVRGGRHVFEARYDATDQVAEDDEGNNRWGHQFIWTPDVIGYDVPSTRSNPPSYDAGWAGVVDGSALWYNADGVRMDTVGWWSAVTVRAADHSDDYDIRMHEAATGAEDGFASNVAYSGRGVGMLDAVLINRNLNTGNMDAGVLNFGNDTSDYTVAKRISTEMTFGDSVTTTMAEDQYLMLREFYVGTEDAGFVSVTIEIDPGAVPVNMAWLDKDFEVGTLSTSGNVVTTAADGRGRLDLNIPDIGYTCLVIWRDQQNGGDAQNITLEIQTTPPDFMTYQATGWHSPLVPRPANDGTYSLVALPDTLHGFEASTYFNMATRNDSPTPGQNLLGEVYADGVMKTSLLWGSIAAYYNSLYNSGTIHTISGGRHTLTYELDPDQDVEEISETNNTYGEQYIWSPMMLDVGVEVSLPNPPERTAGWDMVNNGEALYFNSTGVRMPRISGQYWQAVAVMPATSTDVDVRLHQTLIGVKNGFGANLGQSAWGFEACDFMLVDYNFADNTSYDAGVLDYGGANTFRTGFYSAPFYGNDPVGVQGEYDLPGNDIVALHEYYLNPGDFSLQLEETMGNIDWGLSIYPAGGQFHSKSETLPGGLSYFGGPGQGEDIDFTVVDSGYYCVAVWRATTQDMDIEASYELSFGDPNLVDAPDNLPSVTALSGAYPNPFNPQTTVAFNLAKSGYAELVIYDLQGAKVRTLVAENRESGRHEVVWNGTDDRGQRVASGVFMARLKSGTVVDLKKLVLIK
jgi:hypothetical protein